MIGCARGAQSDRCSIRRLCGGQPAGEPRAVKTPGGPCLLDRCCLWCGETQQEHLRNLILRRSDVDDHGASCDSSQQELFTLRAQVAAESGLADAVRAINNLATAQVRKDTPSRIDLKKVLDVRRTSLDVRRISNSGRRRRRHSLQ